MDLDVHVKKIGGTQMAAMINGEFTVLGESMEFTAIAFGRIGGQNIGVKLTPEVKERLEKISLDPEEVAMQLQKNLLQGDLSIPDDVKKEEFVDD